MADRPRILEHNSEDIIKTGEFVDAAEKLLREARVRAREQRVRLRRITEEPPLPASPEEDEADSSSTEAVEADPLNGAGAPQPSVAPAHA